jgi:hypothetical protein
MTSQSALKNIDGFLEKAVDIFFNDDAKRTRKEVLASAVATSAAATATTTAQASASFAPPTVFGFTSNRHFYMSGLGPPLRVTAAATRSRFGVVRAPDPQVVDVDDDDDDDD